MGVEFFYVSFLAQLFAKKAMVLEIGKNGKDVSAAIQEVDRQIQQAIRGGNINSGQGVTKSGRED